jgi:hypothetical protein
MEENIVGHIANMAEMTNSSEILAGRPERKTSLGRPSRRWKENIKSYLRN